MAIDFGDIASRYLNARIDQATQPFTDPETYFNRRLQDQFGIDLNGNVGPRTTTIKTDQDGNQTVTNKIEMGPPAANAPQASEPFAGAAQYALPQAMTQQQPMAQPVAAQPVAAQPAMDPAEEERKRREAALQQQQAAMQAQPQAVQLQAPAPAPQVGPTPEPAAPVGPVAPQASEPFAGAAQYALPQTMAQPQPAAAPAAAAAPAMPSIPQPSPGVKLAGPMVAGAVPSAQPAAPAATSAQPAAAPVSTQPLAPLWQTELLNAKNDVGVYHAVAGNKAYPTEIRSLAGEIAAQMHKGTIDATKAEKIVKDALNGDAKAANTLAADLRKRDTEEGSYIKAYLFSRLGLNDLAREEQEKLSTKKTLGQANADGKDYTTEVDKRTGQILRAWDASGAKQGEDVIAKLQASGYKPGTHAFSSTGDIHITPDGQQQVVKRFNSITGKTEWVDVKTDEVWKGQGTPSPQRISTNAQIALNQKLIDFAANPSIAGATEAMKLATSADPGDGSEIRKAQALINKTPFANQVPGVGIPAAAMPPGAPSAQQVTPGAAPQVSGAPTQQVTPGAAPVVPSAMATSAAPAIGGASGRKPGESFDAYQKRLAIEKSAAETSIGVAGKRSESFNKILDEEVRPQAQAGDEISQLRKQQFKIFDRPGVDSSKIFGIANGAGQSPGDQRWTMLRDVLAGKVSEPEDKIRERAAALGLNRDEQSALAEYNNLNASINARTLKTTAGAGSVSDAEQRANRERNVDPTQMPALGAYNSMAQSQFNGDLARYKGDWAQTSKATNALQLDKEWRKEQQRLVNTYADIAKQRIDYIVQNGSTAAAVKEGYRRFPVPEYDPQTETWKKTRPLGSYER